MAQLMRHYLLRRAAVGIGPFWGGQFKTVCAFWQLGTSKVDAESCKKYFPGSHDLWDVRYEVRLAPEGLIQTQDESVYIFYISVK